jgi:aromatic-L-amino-acid/L-tryptophan decarboxylase
MSDLRDDAAATTAWIARYLEGVRDLPVLAQVEPGQIRAALPAAPPTRAEPFAAVLRDLDEVLLPGITHWNPAGTRHGAAGVQRPAHGTRGSSARSR